MSETVERRLLALLDHPTLSPYGNPIPGLDELGEPEVSEQFLDGVASLTEVVGDIPVAVRVRRISEPVQTDQVVMSALRRVGALPNEEVMVSECPGGVLVAGGGESAEIEQSVAAHLFVSPVAAQRMPAQPVTA